VSKVEQSGFAMLDDSRLYPGDIVRANVGSQIIFLTICLVASEQYANSPGYSVIVEHVVDSADVLQRCIYRDFEVRGAIRIE
jgi:hypothetical protein